MKWEGQNRRWRAWTVVSCTLLLSAVTCWRLAAPDPARAPNPDASRTSGAPEDTRTGQPETFGAIPNRGESHSLAMSALSVRANANEQLAPADIRSLLVFISSPKPGELTDGEWEERVNGVLNLLRRQTEDFETEDGRQEVSSGQFQVSSGESAVPGLTDVLLEMAERNGSKVLRLYAMQHLSLWFGKERDPAKRRAMVGLLERLATTPGDETAGCAVLMLADVRRQVSSFIDGCIIIGTYHAAA